MWTSRESCEHSTVLKSQNLNDHPRPKRSRCFIGRFIIDLHLRPGQVRRGITMSSKSRLRWRWKPYRWWVALILFWFCCTIGTAVFGDGSASWESGFSIFLLLVLAVWAVSTERTWGVAVRIITVPAVWVVHALLSAPAAFLAYFFVEQGLQKRMTSLIAAIPIVFWLMRRSTFFVQSVPFPPSPQIGTSANREPAKSQ